MCPGPVNFSGIAETLFLPLYFRAVESTRHDGLFQDPRAVTLVSEIDYDFGKLSGYDLLQTTVALRVREFDRFVCRYLEAHPNAAVVNLGCGLDTRFQRLDNGTVQWIELDLPQVIDLRRSLFEPGRRCRFIASSVLDEKWLEWIEPSPADGMLFIAEGLFPYLPKEQLRLLLSKLNSRFPGSTIFFDAVSTMQAELSRYHPALKNLDARFKWGLRRPTDFEDLAKGIRLMGHSHYWDCSEPRLGWYNLLNLMPFVRYGFTLLAYGFSRPTAKSQR
jgi:O-methyltransferase involved in polyketide biosynthesis